MKPTPTQRYRPYFMGSLALWQAAAFSMLFAIGQAGCDFRRGPAPDIPLVGSYVLDSYESPGEDSYFITRKDQVIVPSSIQEIGIMKDQIVGRVEDAGVEALFPIENGYFLLDTGTGNVVAGLTKAELEEKTGPQVFSILKPPGQWRP